MTVTRSVEAGELLLVDSPLLVSPPTKSLAQCLECGLLLATREVVSCQACGFPMCSIQCSQGPLHHQECHLLATADFEAEVEDLTVEDDHYAAILPLRCIQLKNKGHPNYFKVFDEYIDNKHG